MKNLLPLLAGAMLLLHVSAHGQNAFATLSPRTKIFLFEQQQIDKPLISQDYVYRQTAEGVFMSAMVKVGPNVDESAFSAIGAKVNTKAGNIWTVMIPIGQVAAFTQINGIEYIELDEPIGMSMDSVRKFTHVDSVHQGINLPMPYAGKDVIIGVIDRGFDYTHPAFYDTTGTTMRLKRVWELKKNGTPPIGFSYGNELTDSLGFYTAGCDDLKNSHGTHVAGIAAGSGVGSPTAEPERYKGMAFESDLVFVGINPDSLQWQNTGVSDIVDGLNYIYAYADEVGKPVVANLSWGSPVGPRDGSSLFSQAVDALSGKGKVLVLSGGNNGERRLHLQHSFNPTDTVIKTFPTFNQYLPYKKAWLDIWGEAGQSFCAQISLYNRGVVSSTPVVCLTGQVNRYALVGQNGDTCLVTITTSQSEFNGKPRIYIGLDSRSADTVLLTLKATAADIHLWNGYVYDGSGYFGELEDFGYAWATEGNTDCTTSDFVSTNSAISVAAYVAKTRFRNINNQNLGFGASARLHDLAPFSSHGPTANGTVKPDIAAPGFCVFSAVNSFDNSYAPIGGNYQSVISRDTFQGRIYYFAQSSGTSMSAPATSGVVALMLQVNPQLRPADVRNILALTAIKDSFTGLPQVPDSSNNLWGYGKINAYQAVLMAASYTVGMQETVAGIMPVVLYPNPNRGSFTLDMVADQPEHAQIQVFDLGGRLVYQQLWQLGSGYNQTKLDLEIGKGVYIARIVTTKGNYNMKMVVMDRGMLPLSNSP